MSNKKFKKSEVFTISAAHMLNDTYSAFLAPLLPLLIEKLGMSLSVSALLEIIRRIPTLFNPFFGLLAEKTEIKYLVIVTPAITAISMSLIGLAPSYSILFILLFVSGISAALFHVPSPVMIKEASGDRIGTGMSWFMVGGESARTIGPLLITAAVSLWGLEGIYRLMPLGLIASFILYLKFKDFNFQRPVRKAKEKGDTRKLLKRYTPFFITLSSYLFFQAGMKSALTLYLPVYLTSQGESLWYAGISLSVLQFFGVLGAFFSGNISDRIGRKNTLVLTSSGSALLMALFIYSGSIYILAFLGLFLLSSGPVLMAAVQDTQTQMPTFMNSMYMSLSFSITSIVVFGIGLLGDGFGLESTYIFCNVLAIGAIPVAFLLTKFIR
ncbi:MAG: MFS transporter [Psychromonas sp.]|nr:MFS transporter [Psychromonas sp.]